MSVVNETTAGGGTHTYSHAEKRAYCDFINQELIEDEHVSSFLPMDPMSDDLFKVISKGILLCKLINNTFEDEISLSKLNLKPKNTYQVNENHDLCIAAAKNIGCSVVNIGGKDLEAGVPHLVMGLLWQIIKRSLMYKIENMDLSGELGDIPPEQILLKWFNCHLRNAGCNRTVTNFSEDIKDAECYAVLLSSIAPKDISSNDFDKAFNEKNFLTRADMVLEWAERLECRKFVTAQDIVDGNPRLNLAFVACLFQKYPDIGPSQDIIAKELEVKLQDVEGLLDDSLSEKEKLENEFNQIRMDFDELLSDYNGVKLKYDNTKDELDSLNKDKLSLEELVNAGRNKKDNLTDKLSSLTKERDDIKSRLENERLAKEQLEKELNNLKLDMDSYNSESNSKIQNLEDELESTMNLKQELSSKLSEAQSNLEQFKQDSAQRIAALKEQIENEISITNDLKSQLELTRQQIDEASKRISDAEQTKEDLFKLLTDTIAELEATKQTALAMEEELRNEIENVMNERAEYEKQLADKINEYNLAMADWDAERQKLLQRIKELEEELAATKAEMRMKLDEAEKEREQALALSDAELRRLLEQAENEKNQALDKVRALLAGNQKQGFLHHFESTLVGNVWKKRYFVIRDNVISWYSKEKRIGEAKPKGVIYCEQARLYEMSQEEAKREFCFQIDTGTVKHNIAAESLEEMKSWMTEIRVAKKKKIGVKVVSDKKA